MNICFSGFYTNPGMNFNLALPYPFRLKLCEELNALNLSLPGLAKKFESDDYIIDFMINAWAAPETDIRGPTKLRKRKVIEYGFWMPFIPNQTYEEQLRHVLKHIEESLIQVFKKNNGDPTGIHETMMSLIDHALAHPELYQGDIPK
jgi:hypothetical protein